MNELCHQSILHPLGRYGCSCIPHHFGFIERTYKRQIDTLFTMVGRFSQIWLQNMGYESFKKITILSYFWLPTGTKCRNLTFLVFLNSGYLKTPKITSFSHFSNFQLILLFGWNFASNKNVPWSRGKKEVRGGVIVTMYLQFCDVAKVAMIP
jgi:hypothetical protein